MSGIDEFTNSLACPIQVLRSVRSFSSVSTERLISVMIELERFSQKASLEM